ncbi:MAG: hypothetical protein JNK05_35315 [Myxococcales bacterium]|nr:hypothetical protein [Myxococcales bacterium]
MASIVSDLEGPSFTVSRKALARELDRLGPFFGSNVVLAAEDDALVIIDGPGATRTVELVIDARVHRAGALGVRRFQARRWLDTGEDELAIDASESNARSLFGTAQLVDRSTVRRVEDDGVALEIAARDLLRACARTSLRIAAGVVIDARGWFSLELAGDGYAQLACGGRELAIDRARVAAPSAVAASRITLVDTAPSWIHSLASEDRSADVRVSLGSERAVFRTKTAALAIDRAAVDPVDARARLDAVLASAPRKPMYFEPRVLRSAIEKLVRGTQVETITIDRARGGRILLHTSRGDALAVVGGALPSEPLRFDKRALLTALEAIDEELEAELLLGSAVDPAVLRSGDFVLVIATRAAT